MAKIYIQKADRVWKTTASLTGSASVTSGSFLTAGYSKLVGILNTSASLESPCGLHIEQSMDRGENWDYQTIFAPSACSGSGFSLDIVGDAARITVRPDSDDADVFRTAWWVRPI